jgi:flagellar biosynthesis/type III secretory pathway M-ring protein FliF/YscJ
MPFLYFPEDKSEYIPAAISFFFFMILLVITFRWIKRISKKQEEETRELEERILRERREAREKQEF